MPNYKIRPLLRKDLPKLIELARAYWRFEKIPGFHPKLYRNLVTKIQKNPSQGRIWVAIEGDRPIGYLIAVYLMSFEYGGISTEIDEFYVKDSERGRGVGKSLLKTFRERMRRQKVVQISLRVGKIQPRRNTFLQKVWVPRTKGIFNHGPKGVRGANGGILRSIQI